MKLEDKIARLFAGEYADPFDLLGMHPVPGGVTVRARIPGAAEVKVVDRLDGSRTYSMERLKEDLFSTVIKGRSFFPYRLLVRDTEERLIEDPYRFGPQVPDNDLWLFSAGEHFRAYQALGAHPHEVDEVKGMLFAVWAPNALRVSVVGDFNNWDGRLHPMRVRHGSGVWELFIPGVTPGRLYKYEIKSRTGGFFLKSDPYAFAAELRPKTASVTWDLRGYDWADDEWMGRRGRTNLLEKPVSIYEVHLGSWNRSLWTAESGYRNIANALVPYVKEMGYTHVQLLPISEHPFDGSWGYQVTGFYAPTSRYGTPQDFMYLVDTFHKAGIGVIVDWVPAHFPRDAQFLVNFDGTFLYEHEHPLKRDHPDWGTLIFNYARNEVKSFLISNAAFWCEKYHIDGLRVDAVASMLYLDYSRKEYVPNLYGGKENIEAIELLKKVNSVVHGDFPGAVMIAEESTAWPQVSKPTYTGGLGFTLKWNMGWMHDALSYWEKLPVHRKHHHGLLTFGLLYAFYENFILVLSHDEVVHGKRSLLSKMPGDRWQQFANLRLLYAFMYGHPGKKLLFMGGEFGQRNEWWHEASLDWHLLSEKDHAGLKCLVRDLNHLYATEPALYEVDFDYHGFEWVELGGDDNTVVSFLRRAKDPEDILVFVFNMTEIPKLAYRLGLPYGGPYREILNTDSSSYGGSNVGNLGMVAAEPVPWNGRPFSTVLAVPPLGAVVLKPERPKTVTGGE